MAQIMDSWVGFTPDEWRTLAASNSEGLSGFMRRFDENMRAARAALFPQGGPPYREIAGAPPAQSAANPLLPALLSRQADQGLIAPPPLQANVSAAASAPTLPFVAGGAYSMGPQPPMRPSAPALRSAAGGASAPAASTSSAPSRPSRAPSRAPSAPSSDASLPIGVGGGAPVSFAMSRAGAGAASPPAPSAASVGEETYGPYKWGGGEGFDVTPSREPQLTDADRAALALGDPESGLSGAERIFLEDLLSGKTGKIRFNEIIASRFLGPDALLPRALSYSRAAQTLASRGIISSDLATQFSPPLRAALAGAEQAEALTQQEEAKGDLATFKNEMLKTLAENLGGRRTVRNEEGEEVPIEDLIENPESAAQSPSPSNALALQMVLSAMEGQPFAYDDLASRNYATRLTYAAQIATAKAMRYGSEKELEGRKAIAGATVSAAEIQAESDRNTAFMSLAQHYVAKGAPMEIAMYDMELYDARRTGRPSNLTPEQENLRTRYHDAELTALEGMAKVKNSQDIIDLVKALGPSIGDVMAADAATGKSLVGLVRQLVEDTVYPLSPEEKKKIADVAKETTQETSSLLAGMAERDRGVLREIFSGLAQPTTGGYATGRLLAPYFVPYGRTTPRR